MSVKLLLGGAAPAQVWLRVSPVVEALTSLRSPGRSQRGDEAVAENENAAYVVHRSTIAGPDFTGAAEEPHAGCRGGRRARVPLAPGRRCTISPGVPARARQADEAGSWNALQTLLEADLRYRMSRLAQGGLSALFGDLHPAVRLEDGILSVQTRCDAQPLVDETRLVLMPAAHLESVLIMVPQRPDPPLLLYPARAGGGTPRPAPSGSLPLRPLIDGQSLALLLDLGEARSVDDLARRHRMRPQSAWALLAGLESVGLLETSPAAPVRYERTYLARLLVSPWCERCLCAGPHE